MNNLKQLHVLVTRPSPAGEMLCNRIQQLGGEATHFPTLAFAPPDDLVSLHQAIAALGTQDWLIFISPQAVYSSVPVLRGAWPHFPPRVQLAAVGAGTARALKEAGYLVAACPSAEWGSEGLLDLPEFQTVTGKNIAIVRGEGGRDLLQKTLTSRGANVSHIVSYQRVLPTIDVSMYNMMFKKHKIDAVVCTSYEGVRNFKLLMGTTDWSSIKDIPLIVISERIKELACDLDFQTIWVARNGSSDAILEMLAERRNELCQIKQKNS